MKDPIKAVLGLTSGSYDEGATIVRSSSRFEKDLSAYLGLCNNVFVSETSSSPSKIAD